MEIEELSLQKKQRIVIGIVIAATVLSLVLPFLGFYAGMCGVCLAVVALIGAFIVLFLKVKVFGISMLFLILIFIGPLSTVFTANDYFKHKFGMDVYSALDAFSVVSDYQMQINEAEEAGNFEVAYALRKKSFDFAWPKISSVFEYQIQQAKANGDLELEQELETQRDELFRSLTERLQWECECLEEVVEEPVAVEVNESEDVEEESSEIEECDLSNTPGS